MNWNKLGLEVESKALNEFIQEASLAVPFRAEFGSIMEGLAEDVYAMQIPEDKHHVDTETAGNTYKVIKY